MSSSSSHNKLLKNLARKKVSPSRLRTFLFESLETRRLLAVDIDWSKSITLDQLKNGRVDLSSAPMFSYSYSDQAQKMVVLSDRLALDLSANAEADTTKLDAYGLKLSRPLDQSFSVYTTSQPVTDSYLQSLEASGLVQKSVAVFGMVSSKSEAVLLNEVIVNLSNGPSPESFFADPRFSGYRRLDGTPDQFVGTIKGAYGVDALSIINELDATETAEWVTPNFYQAWQKYFIPNDPRFSNEWHLHNTGQGGGVVDIDSNLPEAWDVMPGGSASIVVGVVDDGVPTNHPDILNWVNTGEIASDGIDNDGNGWIDDINGWNFVGNNNVSIPDTSSDMHGTSVSGVAAAIGNNNQGVAGPAFKSPVLSARIFQGSGVANDAAIASAVYYAAGRKASGVGTFSASTVVNNSWGGGAPSLAITGAFNWATTQGRGGLGIPEFIAAGNDYGAVSYPGSLSATEAGVICVGAINNFGNKSDYSNFGPEIDFVTGSNDVRNGYLAIDTTDRIGADGYNNAGDYTGTGATGFGGTSSATPLAAGIGALTLARAEELGVILTAAQLKQMLKNNTKLVGRAPFEFPAARNNDLGSGLLNAATTLTGVGKSQISVTSETAVVASNSTQNIGQSVVGGTYTVKFRIRNQGTSALSLGSITVTGADYTVAEMPSSTTLQLGESTFFSIRLKPTSAGTKLATIRITSNDANLPLMQYQVSSNAIAGNVSGYFYEDFNGDGQFNDGEAGLPNQQVILDANNNGVVDYTNFTNSTGTTIVDNSTVTSLLNVTGFSGSVKDLNVTLNITHTWVSDVTIQLVSPTGARATLVDARGSAGTNFTNTTFDDDASASIAPAAAPFTGTFRPESSLSVFNNAPANGIWRMEITDGVSGDSGSLLNWTLSFSKEVTTTNDDGFYSFQGVSNGSYTDIGVTPSGYTPVGPSQYAISITSPTTVYTDRNFGVTRNYIAYAYAFEDYDRDGIPAIDEPGLANRTFIANAANSVNTNVVFNTITSIVDLATVEVKLNVPQGTGYVQDLNVSLNLTHTWDSDLEISLISPSGVIIDLTSNNGSSGDNYTNTVFDDSAATSITAGSAPFTGTFKPEQPLSTFNGTLASGMWTLRIADVAGGDSGNLLSWGLSIVSGLNNVPVTTDLNGWARVELIPDPTTISLVNIPNWIFTSPATGSISLNPTGAPVFNQTFGTRPINLPPTVDPIVDQFVLEDAGPLSIDITGLSSGRGDPEQFRLSLANTTTTALTTPVLIYTPGDATGTITLSTIADQSGQSILTLTVEDAGPDNDFSTTSDNATTDVVFTVTVIPVNDAPLIDPLTDMIIDEDAPAQIVNMSGILAGGGESQTLKVTATSSNPGLIPTPTVNYVSADSIGTLSVKPLANLSGQSTITVTVTDAGIDGVFGTGDELTTTSTFTVTVRPVNDAPTLNALSNVVIDEDAAPYTVNLTGISAGPLETQPLRVTASSSNTLLIANPTVTYTSPSATGSIKFAPTPNLFGTSVITVRVEDGGLDNNLSTVLDNAFFTRTFTVTVNPVSDPPLFDPVSDITFDEDATNQVITITGIDAGGGEVQPLRLIAKSSRPGQIADLTVNYNSPDSTGTIVLNGLRDEFGSFFVTVLVEDGGVDNNLDTPVDNLYVQRTFNVTVRPINDAPLVTVPTNIFIFEDSPLQTINLTGILGGPGETEPVTISMTPGDSSLLLNQTLSYTTPSTTGQITFTPAANKFGVTVLTLRLEDAGPDFRFNTTADNQVLILPITVTVVPVNDPPSFDPISNQTIFEDNPGQLVSITGITAGLDEVQPMRIVATSSNTAVVPNPTVNYTSPNASGSLLLVPVADQSGISVITVTLEDGGVDANLATTGDNTIIVRSFTVTVNAVNDAPTLNPISNTSIAEDAAAQTVVLTGITAGANESQPLRVSAVSSNTALIPNPSVNYGSPSNSGVLIYTPNANLFGTAVITVTVEDGGLDQNLLTTADNGSFSRLFTISVTSVNDAPTITAISNISINEDSSSQIVSLSGITAGPNESQVLRALASSSNPSLISPTVTYTSPASVGSIAFTPAADQSGTAVITVVVEDGGLDNDLFTAADNASVTQTFSVTVVPVNDSPTLNSISSVTIDEDSEIMVDLQGISAGGGESQPLRITATSSNSALLSQLTVSYLSPEAIGALRVVPNGNAFGQSVVTVTVEDGGLDGNLVTTFDNLTSTRSFTVTVNPVNDRPTIGSVADQSINEDSSVNLNVSGISAGGGESQFLRVTATSDNPFLLNPVVTYTSPQSSASLRLQPTANEFGIAVIVLTVEDGGLDNNLSTVLDNGLASTTFTVNVDPVNDKPVIDPVADHSIDEDGQLTINLTGIGAGPSETQPLRVTATSSKPGVVATPIVSYNSPNSVASLQLVTVADSFGSSVIAIQVEDGGNDNDLSTAADNLITVTSFTVTVTPVNDPPTVNDVANVSMNEDSSTTISLDGISAGPGETQPLRITATVGNSNLMSSPIVTYTSPGATATINLASIANLYGDVVVSYTVEDGGNDANLTTVLDNQLVTKSFTVTVLPINDAPSINNVVNRLIEWNSSGNVVNLTGISSGPNELDNLKVVATSRNSSILPNPTVQYASPSGSGTLSLSPVANTFGDVVIDVVVQDGGSDGDLSTTSDNLTSTVSFTVTVNAVPVGTSERVRTTRNISATFDVLANDTDADGGVSGLSAVIAVDPPASDGTVQVLSSGNIRFVPAPGFYGVTQFSYMAQDQRGSRSAATDVVIGVGKSALQNPFMNVDTNKNGSLTPSDALAVIDILNNSSLSKLVENLLTQPFDVDVNGDGRITPTDAVIVIDALAGRSAGEGESNRASMVPTVVVPTSVDAFFADYSEIEQIGKRARRS